MKQLSFSDFIQDGNTEDTDCDFLEYNWQAQEEFERLRQEANNPAFRVKLKEKLGCKCANCGSKNEIEYHHIVPLRIGGTNRLTNIVPLCTRCHDLVHGCKKVRNSAIVRHKCNGRPRKQLPDGYEKIVDDYIWGNIGRSEAEKLLFGNKLKIYDSGRLKTWLKERGIKKIRNYYDLNRGKTNKPKPEDIRIEIWFEDGRYYYRTENGKIGGDAGG